MSSSEDDIIYWQDVLDDVMAGRTENLKCPFCYTGTLAVNKLERKTRIECKKCGHYLEGKFGEDA